LRHGEILNFRLWTALRSQVVWGRLTAGQEKKMGWREKLYAAIEPADPYLDDRLLIVSGLYLLSLLEFDVGIVKSCAATFAAYTMMVLPLGRRFLESVCVLLFVAAILRWTNVAGIK
jgi:hypothetical protein